MNGEESLNKWEKLVKKQLKTDDIYSHLSKENLEGLTVMPFYGPNGKPSANLPKTEESTLLVGNFSNRNDENVFAFLASEPAEDVPGKTIFLTEKLLSDNPEKKLSGY